ncbi:MAG: hypothetical protein NZ555_13500 [Geminicoccaceae bacterium]|nr:hypothetical protein [Geminicoccaceae bacterium]MDW8371182.1 hypothetical protein [Geminicoccaceae bacterium]
MALVLELACRVELALRELDVPALVVVELELVESLVLALLLVEMLALEPPCAAAPEVAAAQLSCSLARTLRPPVISSSWSAPSRTGSAAIAPPASTRPAEAANRVVENFDIGFPPR